MLKYWNHTNNYKKNKKQYLKLIDKTISSGQLLFGSQLKNFEKKFLRLFNFRYGIGVGSGTEALYIALKVFDIKKGDEVITVANTAIPTISAIELCGATPVFVDIGSDHLIDIKKIENKLSSRTKAIIPVHLYGDVCKMDDIIKIANKKKIRVIEDCAQSLGSKLNNKYCGSFGDAGCFSFYPTKILGSYGDAGFVTFKNKKDYLKGRRIRFYGIDNVKKNSKPYFSLESGINSRLNEIQAAVLNYKIKEVKNMINKRKKIASYYINQLKGTNIKLPKIKPNAEHVFNTFTIMLDKRDKLKTFLKKSGIQTAINYQYPIHVMPTFKKYVCKNCKCLTLTEKFSKKILCLPIYPDLKRFEVMKIIRCIKEFIKYN